MELIEKYIGTKLRQDMFTLLCKETRKILIKFEFKFRTTTVKVDNNVFKKMLTWTELTAWKTFRQLATQFGEASAYLRLIQLRRAPSCYPWLIDKVCASISFSYSFCAKFLIDLSSISKLFAFSKCQKITLVRWL